MLKNIRFTFAAALVTCLLFGSIVAEAQRLPASNNYRNDLGTVTADSVRWFGAGTSATTANRHTDSLFATGRDSTFAIPIAGAESILLEMHTRPAGGADSVNVLYSLQVASSPDTTAMWHTLAKTFSGGGTGKLTNAADTTVVILASTMPALADSTVAGSILPSTGDRALIYGSRYMRVIARGLAQAGDSVLVTGIVTVRFPR
jgi:hypothetical protein